MKNKISTYRSGQGRPRAAGHMSLSVSLSHIRPEMFVFISTLGVVSSLSSPLCHLTCPPAAPALSRNNDKITEKTFLLSKRNISSQGQLRAERARRTFSLIKC